MCAWEQVRSHWEVLLVMFWCFIGLLNLVYWLPIFSVGVLNWLCYINRCWKEDCQPVDVLNWLSCWNQWLKQWLTACYSLHYQTPSHEGLAQTTVTSTWRVGCRATFVCCVMFPVQWKHCCSLCGVCITVKVMWNAHTSTRMYPSDALSVHASCLCTVHSPCMPAYQ